MFASAGLLALPRLVTRMSAGPVFASAGRLACACVGMAHVRLTGYIFLGRQAAGVLASAGVLALPRLVFRSMPPCAVRKMKKEEVALLAWHISD